MKTISSRLVYVASLLVLVTSRMGASTLSSPVTGTPPHGSYSSGAFDTVNLANLNVHFSIPIYGKAGAGGGFHFVLSYDSLVWVPGAGGYWAPIQNMGWRALTEIAVGYVTRDYKMVKCDGVRNLVPNYSNFVYHDRSGNWHPFPDVYYDPCAGYFLGALASDGSGFTLETFSGNGATVYDRSGSLMTVPALDSWKAGTGAGNILDPNNNRISTDGTNFYDSMGAKVLTASGTNPLVLSYPAPNGGQATVTISYVQYWMQTCFQVPGEGEYAPAAQNLIDTITLPDGTAYHFTYETTVGCGAIGKTTGRITSVTMPTGGTISYSYSGGCPYNQSNCMMGDGSPSALQRNWGYGTWTYTRAPQPGHGLPQTTTVVLDPASPANETDLIFSGIYETSRHTYQGNGGSKVLLRNTHSCYNGNWTDCDHVVVNAPITYQAFFDGRNEVGPYAAYEYWYNTYGLITNEKDHDFTPGNPTIRTVNTTYNTTLCAASRICDRVARVQVLDGAQRPTALTNFTYDTKGNATQVSSWVSGNAYLNTSYTYNANGTPASSTDPNGTATTYSYAGNSCNGAFPTSVSVPTQFVGTLTTQYGYNCTGGVQTSVTDPNGTTASTSYTDPYFWRPASTTDQMSNKTYFNYYKVTNAPDGSAITSPGQTESVLSWTSSQGNSTVESLTTVDGYGRPTLQQKRQGPGSAYFDTVKTAYDGANHVYWVTAPFQSQAPPNDNKGSQPATYWSYDGLGRPIFMKNFWYPIDVEYSYNANDILVTTNPAPAGERPKRRQYEYDALGRLTSVCELTNTGAAGACKQNTGQTGLWTTYQYDASGNLVQVSQDRQAQAYQVRYFNYDGLNRLTGEFNPETSQTGGGGWKTYTYDSDATCGSHPGDKVKRVDSANNVTCYVWDGLHRLTNVNYVSGPNQPYTMNKEYSYDFANPDNINVSYPKGRMVEAHTWTGQNWVVSQVFGYNARGEMTDTWAWIPDGTQWYHTVNGYAPNGVAWQRMGYLGTGTTTPFTNGLGYVVDGEGRLSDLWDHNLAASIWWGTTFNPAGQPDYVKFYNGDYEGFQWDQTTGHMNQWTSVVGSKQQTGTLTWNANGTLQKLLINDTANTNNSQSCSYLYDDLARIAKADCPGHWSQTFNYDSYGNIWKQGNVTFNPGYVGGNHVQTFGYDAMGNVTTDGAHTYTYDAEGRQVKVDGTNLFLDAFNRVVEVQAPGAWREYVYAPDGLKFAKMNGASVVKVFAPLTGGVSAVYGPYANGLSQVLYWQHADWLGSTRMASTPGHTVAYDTALAPFGETYAEINDKDDRSFTGQTQDTAAGLNDFMFRQQSPSQSRWLAADLAGLGAVDITNPQTWNRYAYVGNNPLSQTDLLGLFMNVLPPNPEAPSPSPQYWEFWGNLFASQHVSTKITLQEWDDIHPHRYSPITITVDGGEAPTVPLLEGSISKTAWWAPQQSATAPNCFMWYGNWGGPCLSGGQHLPLELLTPEQRAALPGPVDARDACYMPHDYCYYDARLTAGTTYGSSSKPQQVRADTVLQGGCDLAVSACLGKLGLKSESLFFGTMGAYKLLGIWP